jgi:hypothetical protein
MTREQAIDEAVRRYEKGRVPWFGHSLVDEVAAGSFRPDLFPATIAYIRAEFKRIISES